MTMAQAIAILRLEIACGTPMRGRARRQENTDSSRLYRAQTLEALLRTWVEIFKTELPAVEVRKVLESEVRKWADTYVTQASPTRYNNTVGTLRRLFEIAIDAGEIHHNPAAKIKRTDVRRKELVLPSREMFGKFIEAIRARPSRFADDAADFVQFLAYTGSRKEEAAGLTWADVDFKTGYIVFRQTKNSDDRRVPMIGATRELLTRLQRERGVETPDARVLRVGEAEGSMTKAAKAIGMPRIVHHDLRHLFATVCIESGCDIPTVSRWLGHRDGGTLALKTYGHLRDEHSLLTAEKVRY